MKKLASILLALVLTLASCVCASADQSQAKLLAGNVIGYYADIVRDGTLVDKPDADEGTGITKVYAGSSYVIYGWHRNEHTHNYWYLISIDGRDGWISATICNVDTSFRHNVQADGVGYCYVTGHGVNGKSGPGTQYSYMAYCEEGNGFLCLDMKMGNTGKYWVKVRIQGIPCWISTGLCEFHSYN